MNQLLKNPMFYYIVVPLAAAVWPGWVFLQTLPEAQKVLEREKGYVTDVNNLVQQILTLDPGRLRDPKAHTEEDRTFSYAKEVDRVAKACRIRSYKPRPETVVSKGQRKTQAATVTLEKVGLVETSQFISTILKDWPDLECDKIELDLTKGETNVWKVKLGFNYVF